LTKIRLFVNVSKRKSIKRH